MTLATCRGGGLFHKTVVGKRGEQIFDFAARSFIFTAVFVKEFSASVAARVSARRRKFPLLFANALGSLLDKKVAFTALA
jgi:hypothetical protein